ncbi:MAG TPA: hypothetical protein VGI22_15250 [Xanthobacteraceae bacterium]|jgi:hypothetical protein
MKNLFAAIMASTLVSLLALSDPALAQQKTAKACQDEWRANKQANQAAGVTEKAYVDKCRAGGAAEQPAAAPGATPAAAKPAAAPAPSPALAAQKTAKQCQQEWRANKEGYQAASITEKAYVDKCRAGETVALPAAPAAAPAATPAPTPASAPATKPAAAPAAKPAPTAATAPTGAGEFPAEAQAKAHCPTDTVIWANLKSKIYHFSGSKDYGATKEGAYMCEKDALAQGVRAAKNEKHP